MTQDMKKVTLLHTMTKLLVRNRRTQVRLAAHSSALTGGLRTILLVMMVVGIGEMSGQTYYVFKYDGHYVAHNGYTTDGSEICVEDEFSIEKCLWEFTDGGNNARRTDGLRLRRGQSLLGIQRL